jgi:catechol 2,3-dioxygenase-like lactoylglutathione lyase family enzyme
LIVARLTKATWRTTLITERTNRKIIGPEDVVFGVDNVEACRTYLRDYGLSEVVLSDGGFRFEAVDGTAVTIREGTDPVLPAPLASGTPLRQTVWGCEDQATVDAIAAELSRDRAVERHADGSITTEDDVGFKIAFRVTTRRAFTAAAELVNSPGAAPARPVNEIGADDDTTALPLTLSHVVYFTPDAARMESFYVDRLGFLVTDRFGQDAPFLRPRSNDDHHCLFLLHTPPHMQGLEHVAFHVQGPTSLMAAGTRFVNKGYESFWGPGRHKFGSNWFWYFNSPMGCHVEYDADMDKHDDDWVPRMATPGAEASQMFLFENVEKFFPGGPSDKH